MTTFVTVPMHYVHWRLPRSVESVEGAVVRLRRLCTDGANVDLMCTLRRLLKTLSEPSSSTFTLCMVHCSYLHRSFCDPQQGDNNQYEILLVRFALIFFCLQKLFSVLPSMHCTKQNSNRCLSSLDCWSSCKSIRSINCSASFMSPCRRTSWSIQVSKHATAGRPSCHLTSPIPHDSISSWATLPRIFGSGLGPASRLKVIRMNTVAVCD